MTQIPWKLSVHCHVPQQAAHKAAHFARGRTNAGLLSALDGDRYAFVLQCAFLLPAQYMCILKLIHMNQLLPCCKKLNCQFFKGG